MENRDFVLKPMDEIAPYYRHPVLNNTIHQLLNELNAKSIKFLKLLSFWLYTKAQKFFCFFKTFIKLLIKILFLFIHFLIETAEHIHIQISDQLRIFRLVKNLLHIQKELMPVPYKFFILFQIRCIEPFFYFNLGTVFLCTFMNLKNIFKILLRIISSQWKQPAESRTDYMDGTSAFCVQKHTFFFCFLSSQMRKNISV